MSEYLFKVQSVDEDHRSMNLRRMSQIGFFSRDKVGLGGKGKGKEEVGSLVGGVIDGRS